MSFYRLITFISVISLCFIPKYSVNCFDSSQTLTKTFDNFIDEKDFKTILNTFNRRFISIKGCYNTQTAENPFCRVSYIWSNGEKYNKFINYCSKVNESINKT